MNRVYIFGAACLSSQIIDLLNRPGLPAWAVALIGGLTGGAAVILAQILRALFDNRRDVMHFRTTLYYEIDKGFIGFAGQSVERE
jgi:hypothetical protein